MNILFPVNFLLTHMGFNIVFWLLFFFLILMLSDNVLIILHYLEKQIQE